MTDFFGSTVIAQVMAWSDTLLQGALVTVEVSLAAYFIGLAIGTSLAIVKLKGGVMASAAAYAFTRTFRSIPELLLIIMLYYAGSSALSTLVNAINPAWNFEVNGFLAAIIVLAVVQSAYASEVIRGAIMAVPKGEIEAARAFALSEWKIWSRIILPPMLPIALPGLSNLWAILLKESSLISVVGFGELMMAGKTAGSSTRMYFTFYCIVGLMYLSITLVSNQLFRIVERHFRVVG